MRVLSYTAFPASEKFVKERSSSISALQGIATRDMVSLYHGLQVQEEGAKQGYLVSIWDSPEAFANFRQTAGEKFQVVLDSISTTKTQLDLFMAIGTRLPTTVINSKTSEFAIIKPKTGVSNDAVREATLRLSDAAELNGHPSAVGEGVEGGLFILGVGGDSFTHIQNDKKNSIMLAPLKGLRAIADILSITHANLTKEA